MDWIRRNWPDLLIGIALVAVIAGIIATLLTGGSFFPLGASQASSNRLEESSTSDFDPPTVSATVDSGSATQPAETTATASQEPAETPASDAAPVTVAEERGSVAVSALPLPGSSTEVGAAGGPSSSASAAAAEPITSATQGVQLPSPEEGGTYRISVGAFTGEENAARQADTFREAGYPVFIGAQGDLSIVLVGPYEDLGEAERVAERIRNGGFRIEPVIYRFQADTESDSRAASSSPRTSPAPTPQATAAQATAAQATAGRFLQVGAYATRDSSLPQRERLEGLGFRVTERVESDLVKLLVGPFEGTEMSEARTLLNEQGIDHFPR